MTDADIQPLYDEHAVRVGVAELGRRLDPDLARQDLLLLSLLDGSLIFVADLIRCLRHPVRYELIHVHYSGASSRQPVLDIHFPIFVDVRGQTLLVLKDVVDTAITEEYLRAQLLDHGALEVRFAALIDMPEERKTPLEVDYRVFTARRHGILVGYGMKHGGRYGNLPYIGRFAGNPDTP